jgi:HAMP domain-containing protein
MSRRGDEAAAAAHEACPRCRSPRSESQEFCVECGLRLPVVSGAVPAWRGRWLRRVGWYPGDWVWVSIGTLAVAVAGAAIAIVLTSRSDNRGAAAATVVAPTPRHVTTTVPATSQERNGHVEWPDGQGGWTVVLVSLPATRGRKAPLAIAGRAVRDGLPQVGILDSSAHSSLHPGYYVVFSGIYGASSDAETALQTVRARGFGGAYPRQISP